MNDANHQVDMPWAILRTLGYDDELEWEVGPSTVDCPPSIDQ